MAHQSKKRKADRAYIDHFSHKPVIPERGIVGIDDEDGGVLQYYNWGKFVEEREEAVIPVVREFYANANASVNEDFSVEVRGRTMSYSIEAINQYYGFPDTEFDEFLTYLNDGFDENEVIQSIAKRGAQWLRTEDQASKLRYDDLKPFAKAWMKFINSNIMPSTHYNTVSKDRAALIFSFFQVKSVNIARLIHQSIHKTVQRSTTGGLGHPSLITALCNAAGVRIHSNEEKKKPKQSLHCHDFDIPEDEEQSASTPREDESAPSADVDIPEPSQPAPDYQTAASAPPPSTSSPYAEIKEALEGIKWRLRIDYDLMKSEVQENMEYIRTEVRERMTQFEDYQAEFNNALIQLVRNPKDKSIQFPRPPWYPPPVPPKRKGKQSVVISDDDED